MILRQAPGISWARARAALHGSASAPPLWARGLEDRRAIERCWRLVAAALLKAIAEVHRANVAHLDLRPEHVFVAREAGPGAFTVTLLDFSMARELGPAGHEVASQHTPSVSQQPLRRGPPLPLQDSLRAGLLLAELLFNVPVDFSRAQQEDLLFLGAEHIPARCAAEIGGGWAPGGAAPDGCASAAAMDLLERLCARDASQRLLPSQALYLPIMD
ncbi:hypothetical protein WJX81_001597 [Elliptochloris bilobata]|uniref:Protein kinase domain-containing protein n=1 Tax=Elliptochloris bilobata TaxID=381761 RepID=A0AAW1RUD7_9CHLO